jgi:tetratricopeptide (TPR) repeat protein
MTINAYLGTPESTAPRLFQSMRRVPIILGVLRKTWIAWASLAALAAVPLLRPDDLIRGGNDAFARGDFAAALESYVLAEERTLDPGLVAFNEGIVLYQLARYRDAELHFRRCREDATGARRARLLYNLGNCLVQEAQARYANRLRDAIRFYEQSLEQAALDAELAANARHNLELARLLLQKVRSSKESPNDSNDEQDANNAQPDDRRNDVATGGDQATMAQADAHGKAGPALNQAGDRSRTPVKTDRQPPPGKGNLPPIPDEDDLAAMSPEDAVEHLKQAAARIERERREYRRRPLPAAPATVPDW